MKKIFLGVIAILVVATTALAAEYDTKGSGGILDYVWADTTFVDSSTFVHSWTSTIGDTINIRTMGHDNGVVPIPFRIYGEYEITGKHYSNPILTLTASGNIRYWKWNYGSSEGHETLTITINKITNTATILGTGALGFKVKDLLVEVSH
ncbi:hypothetical protein J4455_05805 [Candidatus Woesearchaeota archaeon]|nr:hypothetical protein [Candidatus Woesearchaeota archaeon]